ncbi:glutamate decarboxylase [Gracilibacillus halophilus YIM-C55.5]|uniref:Glutamate decarboxylase n=1 Tax=Gracilibacillus halophilus YIM-C55.5 TaxID=1308866 RepID=N4WFL5_9BACI|nr:aminotransferase class I/II-fold pyridoxal phosphate-dependent enzyme [Gracilibacillus halophilus]ENH98044.1 glutamate decarboxylase [Gracilibacillus halophilus YIM-C55.5]
MDDLRWPKEAFIHPEGENKEEVRQLAESIMDKVLDYASSVTEYPPLPKESDFEIPSISGEGVSNRELIHQIQELIDCSMNPNHPRYIGHMDSIPTFVSCLGELVSTFLNNNMLSLEMSPFLSRLEVHVLEVIGQMFGYNEQAGGVMVSGGTLANLEALAVARNQAFSVMENGLTEIKGKPVIFASDVCHASIQKACMLLGLGTSAVISVKTNDHSKLDVHDLELQIERAYDQGKRPFAIVATAGTTVTGNIDPIFDISQLADKYQLWLHVDAAYGGALVFSDLERHRLKGIAQADSITFNPQKWMYIAKTCAMVLFKDRQVLEGDFRISAPYMNEVAFTNLGEINVQGTRHADIVKLWLSLQYIGLNGYQQLIDQGYRFTKIFTEEVRKRSFLVLQAEPETNICCFRGEPAYLPKEKWDDWNRELQQQLLDASHTFVSLPLYRGERWLRAVLLNPFTSRSQIQDIFKQVDIFYDHYLESK